VLNQLVSDWIGPRRFNNYQNLVTIDGNNLNWESCIRYLGVYIECAGHFRCSHEAAKRKFYTSFNGIFGKIVRVASEEAILNLISAKCIPCLLYEALPFNSSQLKLLGFPLKRILFKIVKTGCSDIVSQCQEFFNFPDVSELIFRRKGRTKDLPIRRTYYATLSNLNCKQLINVVGYM